MFEENSLIKFVSFSDWKIVDDYEIKMGKNFGRPRVKITSVNKMLQIKQLLLLGLVCLKVTL